MPTYQYTKNPDGSYGVNYFGNDGTPISNTQYSQLTGQDTSAIEDPNRAAIGYDNQIQNAEQTRANDLGTNAGADRSTMSTADQTYIASGQTPPTTPDTTSSPVSSGSTTPTNTAADEAAYYQDQIDNINRLLGSSDTQLAGGLDQLNQNYNAQNTRQANMYNASDVQNAQDKQAGIEGVNTFANQSYRNLQRLLGGAGAGNSSAARTVVPTLVSQSASARRKGVFTTAGQNQANIDAARAGADEDLTNWRTAQEKTLRQGTANAGLDLLQKLRDLQFAKTQATGGGYQDAKSGAATTQQMINDRMAQLDSLFGQYNPTYTANLTPPDLNKYNVDPAAINLNNSNPGTSGNYYATLLKKKQDLNQPQ